MHTYLPVSSPRAALRMNHTRHVHATAHQRRHATFALRVAMPEVADGALALAAAFCAAAAFGTAALRAPVTFGAAAASSGIDAAAVTRALGRGRCAGATLACTMALGAADAFGAFGTTVALAVR